MTAPWVTIENPADPRLSDYIGLNGRRPSDAVDRRGGFFICEGHAVVERVFRSRVTVRSVISVPEQVHRIEVPSGVPAFEVPREILAKVAGFDFHRGVLASADRPPLIPMAGVRGPLVATEGVNDHENLGAILRSALTLGAGGVVLDPTTADPFYRRCVRVSMGAVFGLAISRSANWPDDLRANSSAFLVALSPAGTVPIDRVRIPAGRLPGLMIGSEGSGLSVAALEIADVVARIPMASGHDSLNAGHALAIAAHRLFEF